MTKKSKKMGALFLAVGLTAAACGSTVDDIADGAAEVVDDAAGEVEEVVDGDDGEAEEDDATEEAAEPSDETADPDIPATIVDLALANEDFTTLVAAVQEAGLVPNLQAEGTYTVFAPNNAAFEALFADADITAEDLLAREDLAAVLTGHVVEGELLAADAIAADGTSVETLSGATIDITVVDGAVVLNGVSTVIAADNLAGNGVVHVIDTVLVDAPVDDAGDDSSNDTADVAAPSDIPATIVDLAGSNENFTTLVAAVQEAGLVPNLQAEGTYTVFAPTNAAFEALFAEAGITADDLLAREDLATVLTGHVIEGEVTAEDAIAADGTSIETLSGATIDITVVDGAVVLNGVATVTTPNLLAGNGVVHVIDAVLA